MRPALLQPISAAPRPRPARPAFTLVETLLALTITALIGLAIAGLYVAVASGTAGRDDVSRLVVRQKFLADRLENAIRAGRRVLSVGDLHLVIWTADVRADGLPNPSELIRIDRDPYTGQLRRYRAVFPANWSQAQIDAADVSYALTNDFEAVTRTLAAQSWYAPEFWMDYVIDMDFTLDAAQPQDARLVSYRIDLWGGEARDILAGAAALRNR